MMTSAELQQWRDRMKDNQAVAATLELALIMRGILDELTALRQHAQHAERPPILATLPPLTASPSPAAPEPAPKPRK
jgi:hypothetical protein